VLHHRSQGPSAASRVWLTAAAQNLRSHLDDREDLRAGATAPSRTSPGVDGPVLALGRFVLVTTNICKGAQHEGPA
jgi:hypothetical protein